MVLGGLGSTSVFQKYTNEITLKSVLSTSENSPKSYSLSVLKVQTTRPPWLSRVTKALPSWQYLWTPFIHLKKNGISAPLLPGLGHFWDSHLESGHSSRVLFLPSFSQAHCLAEEMKEELPCKKMENWNPAVTPQNRHKDTESVFSTNSPRENLFNWKDFWYKARLPKMTA